MEKGGGRKACFAPLGFPMETYVAGGYQWREQIGQKLIR